MTNPFFEQAAQYLKHLIAEKKFREAHEQCKKYLFDFPDEKVFLDLREEIEEAAADANKKFIQQEIDATQPLWKEENYSEILRKLIDLLKLDPQNKKIKKLLDKAQTKYQKQIQNLEKEFNKRQNERLQKLLEENNIFLLDELFILEKENQDNPNVKQLTDSFRDKLIAKKIKEQYALLSSNKLDDINGFLDDLRKIDKNSARIADLQKIIDARKRDENYQQTGEFIYKGQQHLDTLMKLGKYDKAIKAAEELEHIENKPSAWKNFIEKAKNKLFSQTRDLTIESIEKKFPELQQETQKSPDRFVKL